MPRRTRKHKPVPQEIKNRYEPLVWSWVVDAYKSPERSPHHDILDLLTHMLMHPPPDVPYDFDRVHGFVGCVDDVDFEMLPQLLYSDADEAVRFRRRGRAIEQKHGHEFQDRLDRFFQLLGELLSTGVDVDEVCRVCADVKKFALLDEHFRRDMVAIEHAGKKGREKLVNIRQRIIEWMVPVASIKPEFKFTRLYRVSRELCFLINNLTSASDESELPRRRPKWRSYAEVRLGKKGGLGLSEEDRRELYRLMYLSATSPLLYPP